MAHHSVEEWNTSPKETTSNTLDSISQVLRGLDKSLEEIGEVQITLLEQEITRASGSRLEDPQTSDGVDLLLVADTIKRTVGAMVSNIKADPEVQKVLVVTNQKEVALSDCRTMSKGPATMEYPEVAGEPQTADIPDSGISALKRKGVDSEMSCASGSRPLKNIAVEIEVSLKSRHGFDQHPDVMDQSEQNRHFPDVVLELVLAQLPLSKMFLVPCLSKGWLATSQKSLIFNKERQRYSNIFGIYGFDNVSEELWLTAFDVNAHKWFYHELDKDYKHISKDLRSEMMCAQDGGLLCFVCSKVSPIVVCNPLTNKWTTLPLLDYGGKEPYVVQLVKHAKTGCYKVLLVCRYGREGNFAADCYESRTGLWTTLNFGLVYGSHFGRIFACQQRRLFDDFAPSLRDEVVFNHVVVEESVFVLHGCSEFPREPNAHYCITEFAWESRTSEFSRRLRSFKCPLPEAPEDYELLLFASRGFILLVADNAGDCEVAYHHQELRLLDTSAEKWHHVPGLKVSSRILFPESHGYPVNMLRAGWTKTLMCELRWDAIP